MNELCLDGIWQFCPDPFNEGEVLGWHTPEHDASRWREVSVPTVFDRCGLGMAGYEGAAWFRKTVFIPKDWEGKSLNLLFRAVNYRTKVWVNGVGGVGENTHGFTPFSLGDSAALKPGQDNVITVRVDNTRRAGDVPGRERGWRPYGGIIRSVFLQAREFNYWVGVRATASEGTGNCRVEVTVMDAPTGFADSLRLAIEIEDASGKTVAQHRTEEFEIPGHFVNNAAIDLTVEDVRAWSPDSPSLYRLHVRVLSGDEVRQSNTRRFGFRSVTVENGRVCLNGEPILLYGFNRHEDSPRTDMAADVEIARQDLLRMKQMGANFVRLCHYPHDPATLDLCDEIGLLVMAEIPLYWWNGLAEGEEACEAKLLTAQGQLSALILGGLHHPSVIAWAVSNETEENRPEVVAGNAELVRMAKRLDPTRLATHVSNKWTKEPHFEDDDLISLNGYPTWGAHSWGEKQPHYAPSEGGKWWTQNLNAIHERYPDKPILVTEFGYPAIEGVHDGNISEEAQTAALSEELSGILRCPFVSGAAVWCWADHPWPEEDFINRLTTSPFGVVTRDRQSKAGLATMERAFRHRSHWPSLVLRRATLDDLPDVAAMLPPGYTLRTRRDDDLPKLADLMNRSFPEIGWDEAKAHDALIADETVKTTFIIEHGDELVATASARWQPDRYPHEGYVHWVGADPNHRGKNLGLIASLATLHEFARWGAKGSILHTDDFRVPAIKVYLKLGFVPVYDHATHAPRWAKLRPLLGGAI